MVVGWWILDMEYRFGSEGDLGLLAIGFRIGMDPRRCRGLKVLWRGFFVMGDGNSIC